MPIPPEMARLAHDEAAAVWDLYASDVVVEMYLPGNPGAVLVVETTTKEEAEKMLAGLPLIKAGLIDYELIELRPFGNFERLFDGELHA